MLVWRTSLFPHRYFGIPGLVVQVSGDRAVVTCGENAICVHEVQLENSECVNAAKVLRYGERLT